jgi:lipoprotein-releasing system permease protein
MRFELFVAKRYLTKGHKYAFVSTISIVSIIGIAIGTAALIVALSLVNGFHGDILGKILSATPHIMIKHNEEEEFGRYRELVESIKNKKLEDVVSVEPVVFGTVLVKGLSKNSAGAMLKGIDLNIPRQETWLKNLYRGNLPVRDNQLALGNKMAHSIALLEGENCTVIAPGTYFSGSSSVPEIRRFEISGTFESGLYEIDDQFSITNLKAAQALFRLGDKVNYIQVTLRDIFNSEEAAEKIRGILPPDFKVVTWKELKATLYSALKMEKRALFLTLTLIIIVASLNIIAGLMLLVIEKIKDIAILLSYGATPRIIRRIFFLQGCIIGILGTGAGAFIGINFCYLANKFELIKVPVDIYQMSYLPFSINWIDFLAVAGVSLLISFTATLIPAGKASSVNVVEAIKNE